MNLPRHDPLAIYDACVDAIGIIALRSLFEANRISIQQANTAFDNASKIAAWFTLPRVLHGNPQALVVGTLSKKNLVDLYSEFMVKTKSSSRDIYDDILATAGGFCPFCADLGHVKTLDHYLPKAYFPAYSVHPSNLIPCCRDCNLGKKASFGVSMKQQTLHPYLDHIRFFDERWIKGVVSREAPVRVKFECEPPANWSDQDKERVRHHFIGYNLASRFSLQAGAEVAKVVEQRSSSLSCLSSASFHDHLLESANSQNFVLNGWNRTMYAALASTDWFIQADFQVPNWHL